MKKAGTILLVDDEAYVRDSLAAVLARRGFDVRTAGSAEEALDQHELDGLDGVVTDLKMPGAGGVELLRRIVEREPGLPVVVLTGHGTVPSAVECMQAGAAEYLLKPVDPDALVLLLQRTLREAGRRRELDYLRSSGELPGGERLLGVSDAWRRVLEEASLAAPADTTVLILGESGTGKEEVANYLHRRSGRKDGPFVSVNCAAVPVELFESEFFGHRRGSFTGAVEDRVGRLKVADHGSLFLDEINSLPMLAQAKVLRALQDGIFERLGDSKPSRVDVRVVCASNTDLEQEAEAGRFRRDLYYRIAVMTIRIPPLRERPEDIPVLADAFLREFSAKLGKGVVGIEPATLAALRAYSWPGNVRELRNVVERGVLLETGDALRVAALPADVGRATAVAAAAAMGGGGAGGSGGGAAGSASGGGAAGDGATDDIGLNLRASLKAEEKRLLEEALRQAAGVRREAARLLGIDERNLSYYMRKHEL